jgi:hypothetical protein
MSGLYRLYVRVYITRCIRWQMASLTESIGSGLQHDNSGTT